MGVLLGICALCCAGVASWFFLATAVGVGLYSTSFYVGIGVICSAAVALAAVYLYRAMGHRKTPTYVPA